MYIYFPPDIEDNEDATVSSAEPGSGSDSGSGERLTEEDEHIRKVLDLQRSIPYKERKNHMTLSIITNQKTKDNKDVQNRNIMSLSIIRNL